MKIKDKTQNPQSFYFHLSLLTGKIYKKIMACQKADIMDESFFLQVKSARKSGMTILPMNANSSNLHILTIYGH